ncbi:protein hook homolog isoform X1 [Montipora foliosa]|uniref:protein hook homolog isoform X1 n=1 Tax=Montipora foliosa TaxID=591990 RepID=UPI0035F18A58
MQEENWLEEKATLLMSIREKEKKLKEYEQRFLPTTAHDERDIVKENGLRKKAEALQSKVDTLRQEVEVLRLKKKLKELEDENEALISSTESIQSENLRKQALM